MAARLRHEGPPTSPVTPEEVRLTLERVLSSKHFIHAPMKRRFLRLVCEFYLDGRANELNEYLIGREVFERDDTYNPAADPIVRVGAHDVRKKLELYYEGEGANDEIRLEMPVGSYEPVFVKAKAPPTEPAETSRPSVVRPAQTTRPEINKPLLVLGACCVVLLAATTFLWWSNRGLEQQITQANAMADGSSYGAVWQPFFKGDEQTLVVLSNPPVYRFTNPVDPQVAVEHSVGLTDAQVNDASHTLRDNLILKQKRALRLVLSNDDYTGMGEAIGLYRITDLFRSTGRTILLKQSRTASAEDLKNHNVILLGSAWANEWSGKLALREDFYCGSNSTIENRQPSSGEALEYRPEFDSKSGDLQVDYALITVKPNISLQDTIMVLAGIHSEGTEAAAEYVTTRSYINDLNQKLQQLATQSSPPRYYQALLKVSVENGIPTTMSLLAVHELRIR
jgi:hypothetical protein